MSKVKITLVKSMIDRPLRQKETLKGLGLKRINQSVVRELNPPVEGMINKISHLIAVEEIN